MNEPNVTELLDAWSNAYHFINYSKDISIESFYAVYCMVLEEYCKANDLDIVEEIEVIKKTITEINESLGRY